MTDSKEQETVSVEKTQTETFTLRWKGRPWWAIFYVDEAHGALSIQSDFGDYSYRWGAPSKPFKKFLSELDDGYLKIKLSHGTDHDRYFYERESFKKLREAVDKRCKERGFTKKQRKKYDDAVEEIDEYDCRSEDLFSHLIYHNEDLVELFDPYEIGDFIVKGYSPRLEQFVEKIWPSFVDALKADIGKES